MELGNELRNLANRAKFEAATFMSSSQQYPARGRRLLRDFRQSFTENDNESVSPRNEAGG
jgi:hypothetical protein